MSDKKLSVFISHCAKDTPLAGALYQQLKQTDWAEPWLDSEDLQPAQDWMVEILMALRSANVGLVCISKNALPPTGQLKREIHEMLELTRTRSREEFQILTLRLGDAPIPAELAGQPAVEVGEDLAGVVEALKKNLVRSGKG